MKETIFKEQIMLLILIKQIKPNTDLNNAFYVFLKDEFSDEEFKMVCHMIIKDELLYNKYPDISVFFAKKKELLSMLFGGNKAEYLELQDKIKKQDTNYETRRISEKNRLTNS